jgi:hypothetical protein
MLSGQWLVPRILGDFQSETSLSLFVHERGLRENSFDLCLDLLIEEVSYAVFILPLFSRSAPSLLHQIHMKVLLHEKGQTLSTYYKTHRDLV